MATETEIERLQARVAELEAERDEALRRWNEAEDFARDKQWSPSPAEIVARLRAPQDLDADVLFPQHSLNDAADFIEREFLASTRTQETSDE